MITALLSLGSNMGPSEAILKNVFADLAQSDGIVVDKISSLYLTKPVGFLKQKDFTNAAVSIRTSLEPLALLKTLQDLERKYKRVRLFKDGPRTLDIDIIAAGSTVLNTKELILPHPRFHERAFVLVPLDEIAPDFIMPKFNLRISELKQRLGHEKLSEVRLIHDGRSM